MDHAARHTEGGDSQIDRTLHERRLRQFLNWLTPLLLAFAVAAYVAFVITGVGAAGATAAALIVYAACVLAARRLVARDRPFAAMVVTAGGLVPASIAILVSWPTLAPVIAVSPLMAFGLVLPFVSGRQVRVLQASVLAWTATIALIVVTVPAHDDLPAWFEHPFLVASLTTIVALVVLLLLQFSTRLRESLEQAHASEAALRASEGRSRSVLDSALDAVVTMDAQGRITGWSRHAAEVFGFTEAEAVGRDLADTIIPAGNRGAHRTGLRRFLETGEGPLLGLRTEVVGLTKDGREIPVELSIAAVQLDDAHTFSAFVRDISDRRELEEIRRRSAAELLQGQDDARQRIAESIHDDPLQYMAVVRMRLHALRSRLKDTEHLAAMETLDESVDLAVRRLRHLMFELHPRELETGGVGQALRLFADGLEDDPDASPDDAPVLITIRDSVSASLIERDRRILYRIAQEALASARGRLDVRTIATTLTEDHGGALLEVRDDGSGQTPHDEAAESMVHRAELAGGWCRIDGEQHVGTTVTAWIPVRATGGGARVGEGIGGRG